MGKIVKLVKKIALAFGSRYYWLAGLAVFAALFFVPHAALADGLTDVSAVYEPICDLVKQILFLLMTSAAYIFSMSHLLQWILIHPEWLNLHTSGTNVNALVATGLNFSRALANMLLIVAFLAIAFGFIFKVETFQSKKALPLFFVVAILANFAPTFVGMIVDISTVINNTLILGSQTTIVSAFNQLVGSMVQSIISLGTYLAAAGAGTVLPEPLDDAFEILNIGYFVAFLLPVLPIYFAQIMVGFAIGGILFMYVIFFMSRIYIIQFITIVSPLAVVAYALPQTRHFYTSIFSELIKWTFVGNIVLFLLVIGLRSATSIMPNQSDFVSGTFGIPFQLQGYIAYYLCLFIYMTVIQYIAQQNMPAMGSMIQSSFLGLGGMMMARAVSPAINNMNQRVSQRRDSLAAVDESKLSPEELQRHQVNKAVTGVAAGAIGLGANLLKDRNWRKPISTDAPRANDEVNEQLAKIKEGDSFATACGRLGVKSVRDLKSAKGAALYKKFVDDPDLKKFAGDQYQQTAEYLAAKHPSQITKENFAKVAGQTLRKVTDKAEVDRLLRSEQTLNKFVEKGLDDENYKLLENAGLKGSDIQDVASAKGMFSAILKDRAKIADSHVGEIATKDKRLMQGLSAAIGNDTALLGQVMSSMSLSEQKAFDEFLNDKDTDLGFLAVAAPATLKDTKEYSGLTRRKELDGIKGEPGKPARRIREKFIREVADKQKRSVQTEKDRNKTPGGAGTP